ncbi:flagellar biosynthetic protein FliO [Alkalispirochaeta americana]|uniref:flagellar biosynthetic protein FliO n=1 Tax=Alkalispirochaeta americana TaxID=159291 RepID=UPI00117B2CD0|nr:flagellar biosynthetic protein FliO [Alkalispirochaeta americana]
MIDEAPLLQEGRDESVFRFQGAPAEGAAEAAGDGGNTRAFGIGDLLRMVLVLLLVIGAVYGIISFLRRRVPHVRTEEDSPLRLLASRDLGTNTWLYAVMVGREVLLLGGGEGSLQLISRVEDQETIDELVLAGSQKTAKDETPPSFGVLLGRLAGNAVAPGNGTAAQPPRSFLAAQQERLRKMRR